MALLDKNSLSSAPRQPPRRERVLRKFFYLLILTFYRVDERSQKFLWIISTFLTNYLVYATNILALTALHWRKKVKKIIIYALLAAICLYAETSYALDWFPASELREEEITAIRNATGAWKIPNEIVKFGWDGEVLVLLMEDGSLAIYGSGGGMTQNIETAPNTDVLTDSEYSTKQSAFPLTDEEILKSLVIGLEDRLYEMKWDKKYDYTETDVLFSKIIKVLIATTFPEEDTWSPKSDPNLRNAIEKLAYLGRHHGRRYGTPIVELLELLSRKYSRNELLSDNLRKSLEGLISIRKDDVFYEGPEIDKPSAEEQIIYAGKLLEFYQDHPNAYINIFEDDRYKGTTEEHLKEIAPEILQKLRALKIERLR